jgi:hypothetical protein
MVATALDLATFQLPRWATERKKTGTRAWRLYSVRARILATMFKGKWFGEYDPTNYHLDHKFSIWEGFKHQVPLEVIGGRQNLEVMLKRPNLLKGVAYSITLAELYQGYKPDAEVDEVVRILLATDDEDQLERWGLFAHYYLKAA